MCVARENEAPVGNFLKSEAADEQESPLSNYNVKSELGMKRHVST